jgi:hypothetical protein
MAIKLFKINSNTARISSLQTGLRGVALSANFPASFFAVGKADGGDIRVFSDEAKTNALKFQLVSFDQALKTIEIWFETGNLLSATSIPIFFERGDLTNNLLLVSDPLGRNALWAGDEFVSHHNNIDSAGKHSLTKYGGQSGDNFDGSERVTIDSGAAGTPLPLTKPYSISCMVKPTGHNSGFGQIFSPRGSGNVVDRELSVFVQSGKITTQTHYGNGGALIKSGVISYGTEYHLYAEIDVNDQTKLYLDGVEQTGSYFDYWYVAVGIGGSYEAPTKGHILGDIKFVRARNGVYSADKITVDKNLQKYPLDFWGLAIEVVSGVSGTVNFSAGFNYSALGFKASEGSGSFSVGEVFSAHGSKNISGGVSLSAGFNYSSSGAKIAFGSAALSGGALFSSAGSKRASGNGFYSAGFNYSASGSGVGNGVYSGTVNLSVGFNFSASGSKSAAGFAAQSAGGNYSTFGGKQTAGNGSFSAGDTGLSAGTKSALGTGQEIAGFNYSVSFLRGAFGTAIFSAGFNYSASGGSIAPSKIIHSLFLTGCMNANYSIKSVMTNYNLTARV